MEQNIFLPEYFRIVYYLCQLKNTLNIDTTQIDLWKSNRMSEENKENITKSESNFASTFVDHHVLRDINFNGHCLKNNICIHKKVINVYISHTLTPCLTNLNTDFTLKNCLFESVKLTKNADLDKYKYSG